MYKQNVMSKTSIVQNESSKGNTIEEQVGRMTQNGEPLSDGENELIYTDKADGVLPAYNPRADRFDIALDTVDKIQKSETAKRARVSKAKEEKEKTKMEVIKNETTEVNVTTGPEGKQG